jgi:hypothetical protein
MDETSKRWKAKRQLVNDKRTIKQPWLTLVRLLWLALISFNLLPVLLGLPDYYRELLALNPGPNNQGWTPAFFSEAVAREGISPQVVAWLIFIPAFLSILIFSIVGLIIFWRKSDEWIGLLVSYVLVGLAATFTGDRFQFLAALPPFWATLFYEVGVLVWLAFFLFLSLFPDGRCKPGWTRYLAVLLVIWFVLVEGLRIILGSTPDWIYVSGFLIIGLILVGQAYRYFRISDPVQQLQTRWFLFAITVFLVYATLIYFYQRVFVLPPEPGPADLVFYIMTVYLNRIIFALIPLSIGVALFRYRLWDIDLIIRRTLVYGVLSSVLGLVYFGSVVLLRQLLGGVVGDSSVAIVLSTLLIAALFSPLRRALQAGIDRRFFRRKYDAVRALAEFSAVARDEVQLEAISNKLVAVVGETIQPESLSLWMRKVKR